MWWRLPFPTKEQIEDDLEEVCLLTHNDTVPLIDEEDLVAYKDYQSKE